MLLRIFWRSSSIVSFINYSLVGRRLDHVLDEICQESVDDDELAYVHLHGNEIISRILSVSMMPENITGYHFAYVLVETLRADDEDSPDPKLYQCGRCCDFYSVEHICRVAKQRFRRGRVF